MAQIKSLLDDYPFEKVELAVEDPDLDLATASALAREKARAMDPNAMMLSFHSNKTGEYWPKYECGAGGRSPWIVFAEARGCNLLVDINEGEFQFYYLRM
jgi:hypothetical protein